MKPFCININHDTPLMIVPDSDFHANGHPVLSYSYAIYRADHDIDQFSTDGVARLLSTERKKNPDYMGTIIFEQPGKLFSYIADGSQGLSTNDVQEIIDQITYYRENPNRWEV